MKKNCYIMCAALLALIGCTNEVNEEGFVDKANTISFNAYSNKTRAEDVYQSGDADISVMKTGSFGVVGYNDTDNSLYLGSTTQAVEQVWNSTTNTWDYKNSGDMKYWPGGVMDFYAYFPYSANGATFASTKSTSDPVMTINCTDDKQDYLFSHVGERSQTDRVHLYFYHALSKIKSLQIMITAADVDVIVSKVEILNSYTKGKINVSSGGVASYSEGSTARSFDINPNKEITSATTESESVFFDNTANGYIFPTNATEHDYIKGTGQTMWNGSKDALNGKTLPESGFICMKLTCKVEVHDKYLVGDADNFGVMYIPMTGKSANDADITEFIAGRRYIYKIVMANNVGFKENGDPIILSYIKFGVNQVYQWDDVNVTVTL